MSPLVLVLFLLAGVEGLETSARPSCKTCSQSSSGPGNVTNCVKGCAATIRDNCLGSSSSVENHNVPPPIELRVSAVNTKKGQAGGGQNKAALRISWQPNATDIEFLRGFEIKLDALFMQEHKLCRQVIFPEGVRLQPADSQVTQLIFQDVVSGLYSGADYNVMVQSLPKSTGNFLQQTYKPNPKRHGKPAQGCSQEEENSAHNWRPKTPNVTTVGRTISIKAKIMREARLRCMNEYVIYQGKPQDNPEYPDIQKIIGINLTPDEIIRTYFNYTIPDLSPGNYTIQYAISMHDAIRTHPVQVTVQDWAPNNVTIQTNGRNVTVRFDAPSQKYNISKCHVRIFLHDEEWNFTSKEFDPNQTLVTVKFWDLPRGTYRVQVSAPFDDAFPVNVKEFYITDWVPHQNDTKLNAIEETADSTRFTIAFPRPPPTHDYPSFYVYYGPKADRDELQFMEISQSQGDDTNNITVQLDAIEGSDLFFQVSAPYPDADRSDLKHFQIPEEVASPQTWFLGVTAGVGGGLLLVLILIIAYINHLAKKKSTSFTDLVKGFIPGRKPREVPEITVPPKVLVISTKTPPSHGGPNGAVHQLAKFLQTGLYCDVITELTSQREVDLVGAAEWYIGKIEAADYTVVVCPPNNTGGTEEDRMYTHCVRILGEKLSTDPATQHHKCMTVRFEYSGKHTIPQVLRTAAHYKINARDPDFGDTIIDLFCHFHKFERYQLHPESWTIRIGEQDNAAKACRRNLQSVLAQNAAVLGSPETRVAVGGMGQGGGVVAGDGMGPSAPNTPDQLPHGSSLESLMEGEYELEGGSEGTSLNLVHPTEISGSPFNHGGSPTTSMYDAVARSGNVCILREHGAECETRIAVEGEGGAMADAPTNGAPAHTRHVVNMYSAHIRRGYVEDSREGTRHCIEVYDQSAISGQQRNGSDHKEGRTRGQTGYKTPDQVPQEQSLQYDMAGHGNGHIPGFSTHDTGYHSSQNKSEVVRQKSPPYPFRHYPYAGHTAYSKRHPLPSAEAESGRHQWQTDKPDANRTYRSLHLAAEEHHGASLYSPLQAAPKVEASPSSTNLQLYMSPRSRPASPCPPTVLPSGLSGQVHTPPPPTWRPLQSPPPTPDNINVEDLLSQLNRESQFRYMDCGVSHRETRF
ncbi:uncharacterized protein [Branchiostoma lanceolatum]|uniref:uncharacterized protein n=1 Tax=Branchiostoma lanceolatum TaxID=7740 RepID=UPI0034522FAD